jgi:hypothetical protein
VIIVEREWYMGGKAPTGEVLPVNVGRKELKKPQEHLNQIFRRFRLCLMAKRFR